MRQLSSLDALFLAHEGARTVGHVTAVVTLDPSGLPGGKLTIDALRQILSERLPLLPPFRWRLVEVPLNLDHGYWANDPGFDIEYHVRETALPEPGGEAELENLVARLFSQPLDRQKPLWEVWLVQGLENGRCALVSKIHHAIVDGVSGAEVMGMIFDLTAEGRDPVDVPQIEPEQAPHPLQMLVRGAAGAPQRLRRTARVLPKIINNLGELPGAGWVPGVAPATRVARTLLKPVTGSNLKLLEPAVGGAPPTPFNQSLSGHLRISRVKLDLDEVKEIKSALGTTVNDVIMAVASAGVRYWLDAHNVLPDEPLLALVPVSVRTQEQIGTFGNRIGGMVVPLPTHEHEPSVRLQSAHLAMKSAKDRHAAVPADLMIDATQVLPPALFVQATKLTLGIAGRAGMRSPMNLIVSNVPGPQIPLYCAGAKIETIMPVSPVTHGVGMNITVMSYMGRVDAGIVVDREHVPDPELIGQGMQLEVEALLEIARQLQTSGD